MRYTVRVSRPASGQIGETYEFLREGDPAYADRWLAGLYETFATLASLPNRGRIAPESPQSGRTIRQLLYRKYRITYAVLDGRVNITGVRHSALSSGNEDL
ncbi:MAG TPA: type II toxin-antitoxin system RelE/ParE family toxin [Longimicrobium sp.]|nr:type II toxin-antitoxin system RelE/ParE family toxin [Longimicrobium sp.]